MVMLFQNTVHVHGENPEQKQMIDVSIGAPDIDIKTQLDELATAWGFPSDYVVYVGNMKKNNHVAFSCPVGRSFKQEWEKREKPDDLSFELRPPQHRPESGKP